MKKVVGVALAVLGLLLTAAGIAGIVLIGSDDMVESPTTTLTLGDAQAIVSTPALLAFKDTTLTLRAQSSGGAVFIGQAHPIDAKSYLSTAPTYAVTTVDASGMSGVVVKGDPKVTLSDPTKQTFWTAKATGTGEQILRLRLDGNPTEYVVMPVGTPGDVTVTSGVEVTHGFALSIAGVVLGVAGLIAGAVLLRRRTAHPSGGPEAAAPAERMGVATGATAPPAPPAPPRTVTRIVAVVTIGAVVPALASCGVIPTKVDTWKSDVITKPAMADPAAAVAALKDYDARNNAAIKTTSSTFDPAAWSTADTGPLLAHDVYSTRYRKATNDTTYATVTTRPGREIYVPAFRTYPMFALVSTTEARQGTDSPGEEVAVLTRKSVEEPWLKAASAEVPSTSLPPAAAPGNASTLATADTRVTLALATALATQLNSGKGPFTLPTGVNEYLTRERKVESYQTSSTVTASFWDESSKGEISPSGSVQAARTPDGQIIVVTYAMLATSRAKANSTMSYTDKAHAAAVGQTGAQKVLNLRSNLTVVISVDARDRPTIIGHSFRTTG